MSITPSAFDRVVKFLQKHEIHEKHPAQKEAIEFLISLNKKLYTLSELVKNKQGGPPMIEVMQHYDLTITKDKCKKCCLCSKQKEDTIKVVFPIEHGLITGFFVCQSQCVDLMLTVYHLAHFQKRCRYNESINKLYKEYTEEIEIVNKLINKFS